MSRRGDYDWHSIRLSWADKGFDTVTENHVFVSPASEHEWRAGGRTTELRLET